MSDRPDPASRREAAARWFAELQAPDVRAETWEAFLEWEKDPRNAEAYRAIEAAVDIIDRARPGAGAASQEGQGQTGGGSRKRATWVLAAAACILVVGGSVYLTNLADAGRFQTYVTATGEQRSVRLKDGSEVTLNTATRIEVRYSRKAREVRLAEGQASFDVEKSDRPFTVDAGATRTRALGTEFDVRADNGEVAVTLLKGSVLVTPSGLPENKAPGDIRDLSGFGSGISLGPGEQLRFRPGSPPEVRTVTLEAVRNWREGIVAFDNVTLAEAVREMNRYSGVKIIVEDPAIASERISGSFPAGKQGAFVESLKLYLPIESKQTDSVIHIVPSKE